MSHLCLRVDNKKRSRKLHSQAAVQDRSSLDHSHQKKAGNHRSSDTTSNSVLSNLRTTQDTNSTSSARKGMRFYQFKTCTIAAFYDIDCPKFHLYLIQIMINLHPNKALKGPFQILFRRKYLTLDLFI